MHVDVEGGCCDHLQYLPPSGDNLFGELLIWVYIVFLFSKWVPGHLLQKYIKFNPNMDK